jgi:lysozyme
MRVNAQGLALIKMYEGLRLKAYRDAVGIWTIGYGHTSMAGSPEVTPGLVIDRQTADSIMAVDVSHFASRIQTFITRDLNDNQFSSLVSFAYNVGVGAFAKSSVLKSANAGDAEAVARRLNLWNKAGGRVLPGLVKRRAAEGLLYQKNPSNMSLFEASMPAISDYELDQVNDLRGRLDEPEGKAISSSTTVWASVVGYASTLGTIAASLQDEARKAIWQVQEYYWVIPQQHWGKLMFGAAATACVVWIIRERMKKARDDGV